MHHNNTSLFINSTTRKLPHNFKSISTGDFSRKFIPINKDIILRPRQPLGFIPNHIAACKQPDSLASFFVTLQSFLCLRTSVRMMSSTKSLMLILKTSRESLFYHSVQSARSIISAGTDTAFTASVVTFPPYRCGYCLSGRSSMYSMYVFYLRTMSYTMTSLNNVFPW